MDCGTDINTLPDVVLKVGDGRLPIAPRQYILNITAEIDDDDDDSGAEAEPLVSKRQHSNKKIFHAYMY